MKRLDGNPTRAPKGVDWLMCSVIPEPNSGCWLWLGKMRHGYGVATVEMKEIPAHRFSYELLRGPIKKGLVIDHLCRVTLCVNPGHLEPVTIAENNRRGIGPALTRLRNIGLTHCPNGHPYSGGNLYLAPTGYRDCKICQRQRVRDWRARSRAVQSAPFRVVFAKAG